MLSGGLIPVLGWEQGVEGVAGCRWEWWRAAEDAWSLSDERMTGGLETKYQDILSAILQIELIHKSVHSKLKQNILAFIPQNVKLLDGCRKSRLYQSWEFSYKF